MANSELNRIWQQLHADSEEVDTSNEMTLFKRKTTWSCNAGCDGACRRMDEDGEEETSTPHNSM